MIRSEDLSDSAGPELAHLEAEDGSPGTAAEGSPGNGPLGGRKAMSFWERPKSGNWLSVETTETTPFCGNDAILAENGERGCVASERFGKRSAHNRSV